MNMTDPIADMLTRLRNASSARHEFVMVPASKVKLSIAKILKEEGFVRDFELVKDNTQGSIKINLNYFARKSASISGLKRVSKPDCGFMSIDEKSRGFMAGWALPSCPHPKAS